MGEREQKSKQGTLALALLSCEPFIFLFQFFFSFLSSFRRELALGIVGTVGR